MEAKKVKMNDDMNEVLNRFKEEREQLMKTFTEGYKKLLKDKDEELEKMFKDKNEELEEAMKEERSEFEDLEYINTALCIKLRQTNDEIQEAHQELITVKYIIFLNIISCVWGIMFFTCV